MKLEPKDYDEILHNIWPRVKEEINGSIGNAVNNHIHYMHPTHRVEDHSSCIVDATRAGLPWDHSEEADLMQGIRQLIHRQAIRQRRAPTAIIARLKNYGCRYLDLIGDM